MFKAIIFDFDGVLILSDEPRFHVIQHSAQIHGVTIRDKSIHAMIGRTTATFLQSVLAEDEIKFIPNIIVDYEREYKGNITKYVKPIDWSIEFIKKYSGDKKLALASMSSRVIVAELTKYYGIYESFSIILCKEDVKNQKPDPEIYLESAAALGVLPEECLVVEDSSVGVQSALSAHMSCYVLLNGNNSTEEFQCMQVSGFMTSEQDFKALL